MYDSYFFQQILECLKQREDQPARQAFVIHGGTDARQNSVDDYLQQIYEYVFISFVSYFLSVLFELYLPKNSKQLSLYFFD